MPRFFQKGDVGFVSHITGPTHNLLGLEFGVHEVARPILEARAAHGPCDHGRIDEDQLVEAVARGVADAGPAGWPPLSVLRVVYVVDDSPCYDIYRHCAHCLASACWAMLLRQVLLMTNLASKASDPANTAPTLADPGPRTSGRP